MNKFIKYKFIKTNKKNKKIFFIIKKKTTKSCISQIRFKNYITVGILLKFAIFINKVQKKFIVCLVLKFLSIFKPRTRKELTIICLEK